VGIVRKTKCHTAKLSYCNIVILRSDIFCQYEIITVDSKLPAYRICNSCGQTAAVDALPHVGDGQLKCSSCGKIDRNEEWPDPSIREILQVVLDAPSDQPHYERFSCLLLSACLEDMMKQQLRIMAVFNSSWEEADFLISPLLDAYRGRQRQLQLYSRLGHGTFKTDCVEADRPMYSAQWHRISGQRNHFAHSTEAPESSLSPSEIQAFVKDTLIVFSRIHNKYDRETLDYNAATSSVNPKELRELIKELGNEDGEQDG